MQHLLCAAFAIVVLLLGCSPAGLNAEECYQQKDADKDAYLTIHFGATFGISKKTCTGAKPMGCYEFHTKGPGHIRYRGGCGASECPASAGFDASLHTCVKCKDKASDAVAAAGDVICSSASIVPSLVPTTTRKTKCPYALHSIIVSAGKSDKLDVTGEVLCNTDTACGTARWQFGTSGSVTNYTGCISDCNKELLAAGGSGKCTECATGSVDCQLRILKVTVQVVSPKSGAAGGATTTTKGTTGLHSRALATVEMLSAALGMALCIAKFQ